LRSDLVVETIDGTTVRAGDEVSARVHGAKTDAAMAALSGHVPLYHGAPLPVCHEAAGAAGVTLTVENGAILITPPP